MFEECSHSRPLRLVCVIFLHRDQAPQLGSLREAHGVQAGCGGARGELVLSFTIRFQRRAEGLDAPVRR